MSAKIPLAINCHVLELLEEIAKGSDAPSRSAQLDGRVLLRKHLDTITRPPSVGRTRDATSQEDVPEKVRSLLVSLKNIP